MLGRKDTNFLSEISKFFKKNDSDRAMFTIMNVIKGIKRTKGHCLDVQADATAYIRCYKFSSFCSYVLAGINQPVGKNRELNSMSSSHEFLPTY